MCLRLRGSPFTGSAGLKTPHGALHWDHLSEMPLSPAPQALRGACWEKCIQMPVWVSFTPALNCDFFYRQVCLRVKSFCGAFVCQQ